MNIKLIALLFTLLIAASNSIDLDIIGDFTLEDLLSTFITDGVVTGGVSIGTGLLPISFTGTLSSDLEIVGGLTLGTTIGSNPILVLAAGSNLTVDNVVLNGGSIVLEAGASLLVTGATALESDTVLTIEADAEATFEADVSGEGSIDVSGALYFAADLALDVAVDVKAAAYASVEAGETIFNGVLNLAGELVVAANATASFAADVAIEAAASLTVEAEAHATFEADISGEGSLLVWGRAHYEAAADAAIEIGASIESQGEKSWSYISGGVSFLSSAIFTSVEVAAEAAVDFQAEAEFNSAITLGSGSSVEFSGRTQFNADIFVESNAAANARVIFSSAAETTSEIVAASVEAAVEVRGAAVLVVSASSEAVENTVQFVGGLDVSGSASLEISSGSSASVDGDASFSADTSYTIEATSATSRYILEVQGEVDIDGTVNVVTDVAIEGATEIIILAYESRVEGSVFAEVTVTGSAGKRSLQDSGYEVEYRENEAVLVSSDSSSVSVALMSSMLAILVLLY